MFGLSITALVILIHGVFQGVFLVRVLRRRHREPASRVAWVLIILVLPAVGMIAYFLFGETSIGWRRVRRYRRIADELGRRAAPGGGGREALVARSGRYGHLFRLGHSISGFWPADGNRAAVMDDADAAIAALVADIDAARVSVNLLFYIWLADRNGLAIVEAVRRAAHRGVTVRVLADDIGSRRLIRSRHWDDMAASGARIARALPVSNPFLHPVRGRVDLRNHRKLAVLDGRITYCGSQNCADPEFLVKAKFAPWVDIMVRLEGPVARQNDLLFFHDWLAHVDEALPDYLAADPPGVDAGGLVAQVVGTGPTARPSAMSEMFGALMQASRSDLTVTTPYYVPTDAIHTALCAAAYRGVRTRIVLPARNDSWVVAAASRSYYPDLVEAGVEVFEYPLGLLHAKSITVDGEIAFVGSANLDQRSFDLNYENNVVVHDRAFSARVAAIQDGWIAASHRIGARDIARWGPLRHIWHNAIAMSGPLL